jgi:D-lactate dehydratase
LEHFVENFDWAYELTLPCWLIDMQGKKCTAYPAVKLNVVLGGGTWLEPDPIHRCFTDGNLVTGAAWPGHPEFVSQLMALLGIKVSF